MDNNRENKEFYLKKLFLWDFMFVFVQRALTCISLFIRRFRL